MERTTGMPSFEDEALQLPEIISALSFALDLTEGAIPGHAVRSTLLGMRLGVALGLSRPLLESLYYALQLKDVGCSSNAARMAQLFGGDDRTAKAMTKLSDWTGLLGAASGHATLHARVVDLAAGVRSVPRNARMLWSAVLPHAGIRSKVTRIAELGRNTETNTRELITLRCDRGASILRKLRMGDEACESVRHLDEHWDGSGYPHGLAGEAIPLLARIAAIAQNLDVFATAHGTAASLKTLKRRSGTWFDPEIVRLAVALHGSGMLWSDCEPGCAVEQSRQAAVRLSPDTSPALRADQIDIICEAFADVVDAKSPFTFRHSLGVTETVRALALELDLSPTQRKTLERTALLHDLGKLGVPNSILDKPGRLTPEERTVVMEHPGMSRTILGRISGFGEIARIAGEHHERLDGTGYPLGLTAEELCVESRLLALADCFAALAEERPYRGPLPLDEVLSILRQDTPTKFDPVIFEALENVVHRWMDGSLPFVFQARAAPATRSIPAYASTAAPAPALNTAAQ